VKWSKPDIGKYHAALIRTGDSKLLMLDDVGNLFLIQPDESGYKELIAVKTGE
jgi:outer membrane protein assembly factor BamB